MSEKLLATSDTLEHAIDCKLEKSAKRRRRRNTHRSHQPSKEYLAYPFWGASSELLVSASQYRIGALTSIKAYYSPCSHGSTGHLSRTSWFQRTGQDTVKSKYLLVSVRFARSCQHLLSAGKLLRQPRGSRHSLQSFDQNRCCSWVAIGLGFDLTWVLE
jgi:hypothetical protein